MDTVFGYPGGAILPAYDALLDHPIRHVLVRHEQGATHMADGYARASGRVGVALATSGPGATNLVTGIANAMMDSIPIVCITGQVAESLMGSDAFQETDITGITLTITKHNFLVTKAEDIAPTLRKAFQIATSGRPGPVLVDITKNAQQEEAEYEPHGSARSEGDGFSRRRHGYSGRSNVALQTSLDEANELLAHAKRPVILAGHGILKSGAMNEVCAFAELTQIPVAMTLLGIGSLPAHHPLNLGMMGMHGEHWVNEAIQEADLLLAFGMRFDDRVTGKLALYAPHAKKIHIDIDPSELHKNVRADVAIAGDLKTVLQAWLPSVKGASHEAWITRIGELAGGPTVRDITELPDNGTLCAAHVIHDIWKATAGRAIIATDVGQHQMWAAQYYKVEEPGTFITSGGLGTMGFGVPAAIGAKLALSRSRSVGHRRRRRLPDDPGGAPDDGAGERQGQHRDHQQRLPRHGAAVAAVLPRPPLFRHAAVVSRLRQAGRRARVVGHSRDHARRHGGCAAARARRGRRGGDRFPRRAGRHRLPDGVARRGAARHDQAAGLVARRNGSGPVMEQARPRTIVVRYEHEIDALDRVASILRRQRVRAEAFTAVASHDRATVQATIMFDSSDKTAARIVALLERQVGVLAVEDWTATAKEHEGDSWRR